MTTTRGLAMQSIATMMPVWQSGAFLRIQRVAVQAF
jgi:hypothetical protein